MALLHGTVAWLISGNPSSTIHVIASIIAASSKTKKRHQIPRFAVVSGAMGPEVRSVRLPVTYAPIFAGTSLEIPGMAARGQSRPMSLAVSAQAIPHRMADFGRELHVPLAVALIYYLGAEAAFFVGTLSDKIFAPFWPPNIVLFCALLLSPYQRWWLFILAVFPAHVLAELRVGMARCKSWWPSPPIVRSRRSARSRCDECFADRRGSAACEARASTSPSPRSRARRSWRWAARSSPS